MSAGLRQGKVLTTASLSQNHSELSESFTAATILGSAGSYHGFNC